MADKRKKNKLADQSEYEGFKNSIPEDEIWTYRVEGLQAPHVNKSYENARVKKIVVVAVLVVAISLSIFFSVRAVHTETYKYKDLDDGTVEFIKFSNTGEITEVKIDYANGDKSKPVSVLHEYVFNCDEKITDVTIGKDVREIDGKAFYSCYALKAIHVDEENEYFCDVDGVLFNKDKTMLICYPIDHDLYLREKYGYTAQLWPEDEGYDQEYVNKINTYIVPDTVKTIGMLAFNYSELFNVYLPEGLETLETMCFFRNWHLENVNTYTGDIEAALNGKDADCTEKKSLPDSLKYIGSDAFNSAICIDYMYIPENVEFIGHHAFWGAARKENGDLVGIYEIHAALSEEDFKKQVETGDQWTGQYDGALFQKNVPVLYGEDRLITK
ncbi:MAG: leucine-rich repeat protein [Oscillospiraceae bacterium]|nr:leucine-rich repeat protein [Oscillospiraceae bacterium]